MTDELTRSLRAQLLRHSPRAEDREESERIFRELRDSVQTGVAHLALELSGNAMHRKPKRENPELTEMIRAWMGLRSPMHPTELDHRFAQWFANAELHPELLDELAPRMIASAFDWLAEYERVSSVATNDDEPRLQNFDAWATLALQYPQVAAVLSEVLSRWERLYSRRLIVLRTRVVADARDRGDITAAWNELREIERLRDLPEQNIEELRVSIEDLEARQTAIDAWRNELATAPADWRDVVRMHELWVKGRSLAHSRGIPREWIDSIGSGLEHLQSLARAFITRRAGEWTSLEDVRQEIAVMRRASRQHASLDESWLEPIASTLVRLLDLEIEAAGDKNVLRQIEIEAAAIAAKLPGSGGRHVQEVLRRIAEIVAVWDSLASDDVPAAALPTGVLPSRFVQRFETVRLLASRVAAAAEVMQRGSTTVERGAACREAITMLEEVLADAPQHAPAAALLERAIARLQTIALDERIERWEVAELRDALAATPAAEALHAALLSVIDVIEELAAMRRRKPITGLQELAAWWSAWRALEMKLPPRIPDALRNAMELVQRDVAGALRAAFKDFVERTTSLDEDRDAEAALTSIATLGLRDELQTLTQRRMIHANVVAARARGTLALALLVRDHWGTIERYLPWAGEIFGEAFERAWEERSDEALDALREVALHHRRAYANDERFRWWLEWLDVERSLTSTVSPEPLRRVQGFLQREGAAAFLVRRLEHLIEKWHSEHDDAVVVWASRAFAHLDPPLFPGVDPLVELTRRAEAEIEVVFRACREAAIVDEAFLDATTATLKRTEDVWQRLEQLLLDVPVPQSEAPWPAAPPALLQAKQLLAAFRKVLDRFARWKKSDLRTAGHDWDEVRRLLLRDLVSYPAAEGLERVLRRVEPLTRIGGLDRLLHEAAGRCLSDAPAESKQGDLFLRVARNLDPIIDTFCCAEPEGAHTRRVVSEEYWRVIPELAGDLLPRDSEGDLESLRRRFLVLQENDVLFAEAIAVLWREQPNIGAAGEFDPEAHRDYPTHYPPVPPASIRVRRRFDDFAARSAQRAILRASREYLPEWLQRYVDDVSRGVAPW